MGVLVSGCLFSVHTCLPAVGARLPALAARRPWVPACLPACLGCLHAYLHQTEFVAIFLFSSVRDDSVGPRGIRENVYGAPLPSVHSSESGVGIRLCPAHLQCFDAQLDPISVCGLSQYISSSSLLLVSVDGALTESGDCSDVWNVRYSSARYTAESRRGLVHVSLLIVGHDIHSQCFCDFCE